MSYPGLDRRLLELFPQRLNIGRDVQRLDVGELTDAVVLAPGEEFSHRMQVGRAGVPIADGSGEEFQEAARRVVAGVGDDRRHDDRGRDGGGDFPRTGGRDDAEDFGIACLTCYQPGVRRLRVFLMVAHPGPSTNSLDVSCPN